MSVLLTGGLLSLGWLESPLGILLSISFIPLLWLRDNFIENKQTIWKYGLFCFISFLIWHFLSLSWLFNLSAMSGIIAFIINSSLMTIAFIPQYIAYRKHNPKVGNLLLVTCWLALESLHQIWELGFPNLSLGYGLGNSPKIIQWYSITGFLGGSLWLLLSNIILYNTLKNNRIYNKQIFNKALLINGIGVILIPILLSLMMYFGYLENGSKINVLSVHPNMNCRTEKYQYTQEELVTEYLNAILPAINSKTDYVILPENALTNAEYLENIEHLPAVQKFKTILRRYPNTTIISGAILYELFTKGLPTRSNNQLVTYFEHINETAYTYNSAIQINNSNPIQIRTKKHLVPFEETTPYPKYLSFVRNLIGSFGGYLFSHKATNQDIFYTSKSKITPLICYESAFGISTASYANKGAQAFFVLLNEGWYDDLKAASQVSNMSIIRAIENRRSIVRSSNRGISNIINQKGEIINEIRKRESTAIESSIILNDKITFYTQNAILYPIMIFLTFFLTLLLWIFNIKL